MVPAFPARWLYGLFHALPGDRAFLSPSPVRCASIVTNLTSASRRQNHVASPYASALSSQARTRPSHPAPNVGDDRPNAPLDQGGTGRACRDDLPDGASGISGGAHNPGRPGSRTGNRFNPVQLRFPFNFRKNPGNSAVKPPLIEAPKRLFAPRRWCADRSARENE
jgi:hypothetical protein